MSGTRPQSTQDLLPEFVARISTGQADWHAQRDVGFRSAVEYTLRRAKQFFAAEARDVDIIGGWAPLGPTIVMVPKV